MTDLGHVALARASSLALAFICSIGCSSTNDACDCVPPQITIVVPADIASAITQDNIHLTGAACDGVQATCANQTNGCTAYDFTAKAAGECDIEVDTPNEVFTHSLSIVAQTGCCAGFYASPATDNTVEVPESEDGG